MKLAKIGLVLIISFALMLSVCLPVQAREESGDVELSGTVPLTISDVSASNIGYHGATICWKTNGDATSQVFYDTEFHEGIADYVYHTTEDTDLLSEHSISLSGLSSGTTYHYRVRSATVIDGSDFIAISGDYTFRTLSPVGGGFLGLILNIDLTGIVSSHLTSLSGAVLSTVERATENGKLSIIIPAGTIVLTKEGAALIELIIAVDESPPPPPEDATIIELAYDFKPRGATFDPPMTLTFTYNPNGIPGNVNEEDLVIAYYDVDTSKWVELDSVVDTGANTITAEVRHLTTFAVLGYVVVPPPPPAAFTLSSLGISPVEVSVGETVSISLLVANTGGMSGSYMVTLKINGVKEADKRVTIAAGGTETVTFSVARKVTGSYSVAVDGLSGSFTVAPPVVAPPAPAAFSVTNLSIYPAEVQPNEVVAIRISVANTGGEFGSYKVTLKINGVKEADKSVTIAAGSSKTVSFSVTREEAGTYSVDVDGLSGSFAVVVLVTPPGINWLVVGGIIAGVVAAVVVALFLLKRRAYRRIQDAQAEKNIQHIPE